MVALNPSRLRARLGTICRSKVPLRCRGHGQIGRPDVGAADPTSLERQPGQLKTMAQQLLALGMLLWAFRIVLIAGIAFGTAGRSLEPLGRS